MGNKTLQNGRKQMELEKMADGFKLMIHYEVDTNGVYED